MTRKDDFLKWIYVQYRDLGIKEGNHISTIFYLKTKGKKRGYSEYVQIDSNVNSSGYIVQTEPLSMEQWLKMGEQSQQMITESLKQLTSGMES